MQHTRVLCTVLKLIKLTSFPVTDRFSSSSSEKLYRYIDHAMQYYQCCT